MKFLGIVSKIPRGHVRTAELSMLRETFPAPIVATIRDMTHDHALDESREVWFDHVVYNGLITCKISGGGKYKLA